MKNITILHPTPEHIIINKYSKPWKKLIQIVSAEKKNCDTKLNF